jgi:hypothetical protein
MSKDYLFFTDVLLLLAFVMFAIPAPAHAYYDFAMGTYMIQLVLGVGAAFLLSFKSQIARFFKQKRNQPIEPPDQLNSNDSEQSA